MKNNRTFGAFVAVQVQRGEALPSSMGYHFSESAQAEIGNWFINRVGGKPTAVKQSDLQWLEESPGARKIKSTMDEIMEGDKAPTMADVRNVWERMNGSQKPVNYNCTDCAGTGFEVVITATGAEGARRCRSGCGVPPPAFEAYTQASGATADQNTEWARSVTQEIAARLEKPPKPVRAPPPLVNPLTEEDIRKAIENK